MKHIKETLRKAVGIINAPEQNGGFWLPNIQRPFVWQEGQIERLFDSILREYPIGTLLVWKTKSEIRRRRFIENYKHDIKLTDFYIPNDSTIKMLVLDGQQRLQSLFIGLKGSFDKKELYINILSGDLVAPEDIKYQFRFLNATGNSIEWIKFKDIVYANKAYNKISDEIILKFGNNISPENKDRISNNVANIIRVFTSEENLVYQEVDSIDNPELYIDDDIVEIFIRANSGGTLLGKSDLLFSLLSSSWEEADEKMEELLNVINMTGFKFTRDFILKTCLSLLGKGAAYNVTKFRDTSTRDIIINEWDNITNSIKDVKDFIYGRTFIKTDKTLPSYLTIIPMIYFRYHYKSKWNPTQSYHDYLLRTLLAGAFSGSPDNLIDKVTTKLKEIAIFDLKEIFGVIRAEGRNLEISKETLLNACYGTKEIHLIFNLWYNFNYQPAFYNNTPQVDHIFPQSKLKKIKILNQETGRLDIMKYKAWDRDQIANCMLLTASENGSGSKSDLDPEDWFHNKSDDYLDLHLIPKDRNLWKYENYEGFIEERKALILEKFNYIIINSNI
jgi:hypothetical protein